MRIVLASSPAADSPESMPLGALCVAAAIRSRPALAGLELSLVEGGPPMRGAPAGDGRDGEALAARIASLGASAVGLSVYSWNRASMAAAARSLRAASPGATIFAGGPEATADPRSLIEEAGLDFAIVGEGETAVCAALEALLRAGALAPRSRAPGAPDTPPDHTASVDRAALLESALEDVPGVMLPGQGVAVRAPEEDCSALVSPWLSGMADPRGRGGDLLWELARGCPFACAYCYESKGRSGLRPFPMERIRAELDLFVRSGARYAFVLDPTFDADRERAAAILDLLRSRAPQMRWKFEARAELLDRSLVRRFAALDCSLQIGLQSARPETLAAIGRPGFDRRDFARKIAMLGEAGVTYGIDLIYGLPGDGLRQFEEGVDFALGLEPNHLDLFPLALLPGTVLADRARELGIEADPRPPYLVRSTREMGEGDLAAAAALADSCDRFYTAGRAVAWFSAALSPLRARPSAFLRGFAEWRSGRAPGDGGRGGREGSSSSVTAGPPLPGSLELETEQLGYLERSYSSAGLERLWPALRDLVRLHGAWARALAEGEETELDLSYDAEEALGSAASLAAFARAARPRPSRVRVVPDEEEGARIEAAYRPGPARHGSGTPQNGRRPCGTRRGAPGDRRSR